MPRKLNQMTTDKDRLDCYYTALKAGLTVGVFLEQHRRVLEFVHAHGLTEDYRLGRGRTKKLRDEVAPVARFARTCTEPNDRIRFALNDTYPDCVICHADGRKREIEVTIAQARKRLFLMKELNEKGIGRGFVDVREDVSTTQMRDAMEREPEAYSTDQVVNCIQYDIDLRAQRKKWHQGDTLLVEVDLEVLAPSRWEDFLTRFTENVRGLSFHEVYLTGRGDNGDTALRIK
jgi:hypothetical protein